MSSTPTLLTVAEEETKAAGWAGLTAYERTKRLLDALARKGVPAPSWISIRDAIGKGSSGDINRAKRDWLREHAAALSKLHGPIKGIPDELTGAMRAIWTTALEHAGAAFQLQTDTWEAELEQANAAQAEAELEHAAARADIKRLEGEIANLQELNQSLREVADRERAQREQAERLFETALAEHKETNEHVRKELDGALTRYEGLENRLHQEVDRARQEAIRAKEHYEAEFSKAVAAHAIEQKRAQTQLSELRTQLNEMRPKLADTDRQNAALTAEAKGLREQLEAAQRTIRDLTSRVATEALPKPTDALTYRAGRARTRHKPPR